MGISKELFKIVKAAFKEGCEAAWSRGIFSGFPVNGIAVE